MKLTLVQKFALSKYSPRWFKVFILRLTLMKIKKMFYKIKPKFEA